MTETIPIKKQNGSPPGNLPAHRGNIGLVEQQTGRPSKKSPAEAGQDTIEG
jgi:hypothetical protein